MATFYRYSSELLVYIFNTFTISFFFFAVIQIAIFLVNGYNGYRRKNHEEGNQKRRGVFEIKKNRNRCLTIINRPCGFKRF